MDKVGYPRGLIRYTTLNALEGRPTRIVRPRTLLQLGVLVAVFAGGVVGLKSRMPVGLDVLRDRNALYRDRGDGWVENVYSVRILNKDERDHVFALSVTGIEGAVLADGTREWSVGAGEILSAAVRVRVPAGRVHGGHDLHLAIAASDAPRIRRAEKARFIAP
jgi:polyferredoxin